MTQPNRPNIWSARQDLETANRERSRWLIEIHYGRSTVSDAIVFAFYPEGRALRRISLRNLLLAQPKVGQTKVREQLRRLAEILDITDDWTGRDVGWLIDPRAGRRRLLAWADVHRERTLPWPGFPFTSIP